MYDLIGDIHGHAEELEQMLLKLGYIKTGGVYQHPNRQVIFLGDFIDRGPQIKEVLELVRPMVEKGFAKSVMGNHELNALAFHTTDPSKQGEFLRPHSDKNIHQHSETLKQVDEKTLQSHLQWFRTLPLFLELGDLRVVHACWDKAEMEKTTGQVDNKFLASACKQGTQCGRVSMFLINRVTSENSGPANYDGRVQLVTNIFSSRSKI